MSDSQESNVVSRQSGLILLLITAGGVLLRCGPINESLWIDELHTAWVVSGRYAELAERARMGNNSPAYFLLVKGVCDALGLHEWSLRLVSVLSGSLFIPATYWVCRVWKCSNRTCLLAAALAAIDPHAIFFSGEARTYGLVQLVALIHLGFFSRLVTQTTSGWVWTAWCVTGISLFHLHCTTALVFLAEGVAVAILLALRWKPKTHWFQLLLGLMVISIAMLPATELLRQIAVRRDNWAQFVQQPSLLVMFTIFPLAVYVFAPVIVSLLVRLSTVVQAHFRSAPPLLISNPAGDEGTSQEQRQERISSPAIAGTDVVSQWLLIITAATWIAVPILVAWILTELDLARIFFRRYMIAASVALAPLSAVITRKLCPNAKQQLPVVVIVLSIAVITISPLSTYRGGSPLVTHSSEDWRRPIAMIRADSPTLPVLLYSGLIEADDWHDSKDSLQREYCSLPVRSIYRVSVHQQVIPLPNTEQIVLNEDLQGQGDEGIWLMIRGAPVVSMRVEEQVLAALGDRWSIHSSQEFGRVRLVRLQPALLDQP